MNGINGLLDYLATHQFTVGVCIFVGILILYFLFKKLIKLALLFILAVIILTGYAYFTESGRMPKNIQEALHKAKEETHTMAEKARGVYGDFMALFEKSGNRVNDHINRTEGDKETQKKKKL